jgi:tRNA modification GTPase
VTAPPVSRVSCLTPPGRGAIATLGLCGPLAWEAARQLFRTRAGAELPQLPQPGRFWLGRLGTEVADEVVLAVRAVEPFARLEAHCHGGREVVRLLLDLFRQRGLQSCSWEDFLRHTEDDPPRAAASAALARAPTARTAGILLDQYRGAFAGAVRDLVALLDRGDATAAESRLGELARYAALGRHLTAPWRVTVAGAPNVGKSSLVNALAGYQRSVVAPTPGTTRDVVTVSLAVDGWPVELSDTAGLREGGEELEEAGMRRAREAAAAADLCLWVLDAAAEPVWPDAGAGTVRLVVNKVDLPPVWDLQRAGGVARVSASTGEGLPELCAALSGWLVPEVPPAGAAVPFTERLCDGVGEARRLLADGRSGPARECLAQLVPPAGKGE